MEKGNHLKSRPSPLWTAIQGRSINPTGGGGAMGAQAGRTAVTLCIHTHTHTHTHTHARAMKVTHRHYKGAECKDSRQADQTVEEKS